MGRDAWVRRTLYELSMDGLSKVRVLEMTMVAIKSVTALRMPRETIPMGIEAVSRSVLQW